MFEVTKSYCICTTQYRSYVHKIVSLFIVNVADIKTAVENLSDDFDPMLNSVDDVNRLVRN